MFGWRQHRARDRGEFPGDAGQAPSGSGAGYSSRSARIPAWGPRLFGQKDFPEEFAECPARVGPGGRTCEHLEILMDEMDVFDLCVPADIQDDDEESPLDAHSVWKGSAHTTMCCGRQWVG